MEIIEILEEHAQVQLSSNEIHTLWRCFQRVRESMNTEKFVADFEMTASQAGALSHKLRNALEWARNNQKL
jgi:hypothetical protein